MHYELNGNNQDAKMVPYCMKNTGCMLNTSNSTKHAAKSVLMMSV